MTSLVVPDAAAIYPSQWESDVVLSDGGTAHIRPIRPDDVEQLRALHSRLSPQSIYFRFFNPIPKLPEPQLHHLAEVDYRDRFALVAELDGVVVAVVRYDRKDDNDAAEVAFVVEDGQQRRGLATIMLEHLAAVARSNGIERFFAETLPDNRAMMDVFRHAGFAVTSKFDSGVISVSFPLAPSADLDQHIDDRDRSAVVASIRRILNPTSIAVVGASRTPGTIGYELVHNLIRGGFTGAVLPVNPSAGSVAGIHAYATVGEAPGRPIWPSSRCPPTPWPGWSRNAGRRTSAASSSSAPALPSSARPAAPSKHRWSNRRGVTACESSAPTAWESPTPTRRSK